MFYVHYDNFCSKYTILLDTICVYGEIFPFSMHMPIGNFFALCIGPQSGQFFPQGV